MIRIVTDSTSDLPAEIVEHFGIDVIPAILVLDGRMYEDGVDLSRDDFYERLPGFAITPTTASPSAGTFEETYRHGFESGATHILSLHVSSTLSGIYNAAQIAAKSFDGRVSVIDSGQLSLGLGFQVAAAAKAAATGASLDEVLAAVESVRSRLHVVAMLDTLEYLRRGGRVSLVKAGLGALFRVRLFLELHEGSINFLEQVRTRRKSISRLWELIVSLGKIEQFALLHAGAEVDARELLERLHTDLPDSAFLVNVTTVIGTHVGPGALGFVAVVRK